MVVPAVSGLRGGGCHGGYGVNLTSRWLFPQNRGSKIFERRIKRHIACVGEPPGKDSPPGAECLAGLGVQHPSAPPDTRAGHSEASRWTEGP
jgi:hypothetical protein